MKTNTCWLATAMVLGLPLAAVAQADPADPAAPAQALGYPSAFSDYKPWQDIRPADWRAVNDNVRDAAAGNAGHGGHAGAPGSAPAAAPAAGARAAPRPAAPAPGAPAGHQGHGGHR